MINKLALNKIIKNLSHIYIYTFNDFNFDLTITDHIFVHQLLKILGAVILREA